MAVRKPQTGSSATIRPTVATGAGCCRVAAIQMASGPNVAANLLEAEALIRLAVSRGAQLVVLPEYFGLMGLKETDKVKAREEDGKGPMQDFLVRQAKKNKIWIVGGSIPLVSDDPKKVRNSCLVYDDKGKRVARYDKIHLFGLDLGTEQYHEEKTIEAGSEVVTFDSPFGRIGLSLCYDLRFPELFRAMHPVDILIIPSAFTATTGRAHWEPLVRARAIENLSYVIAAAQGGYHLSGRETHGHSMIVDPWGVVLDELNRGSGIVTASINLDYQKQLRSSLPALKHRVLK